MPRSERPTGFPPSRPESVIAQTIPEVVREAAERFADLEAVVDDDRRMTFAQVLEAVEGMERALIAWGEIGRAHV